MGKLLSTHDAFWIFLVVMPVLTSEPLLILCSLNISSLPVFRYHVGRHVVNLQVTNTYEGTYVSFHYLHPRVLLMILAE